MWVHGNALTVESPENLDSAGHYGWGADLVIEGGKASWFHIPLPTPVILHDARAQLLRVFILFESEEGKGYIENVHIFDGSSKVQEFNGLHLEGPHRTHLDSENTFNLSKPHVVRFGIGITFRYLAAIGFDSPVSSRLIVGTAGADYDVK
jgi:hypothetical protein